MRLDDFKENRERISSKNFVVMSEKKAAIGLPTKVHFKDSAVALSASIMLMATALQTDDSAILIVVLAILFVTARILLLSGHIYLDLCGLARLHLPDGFLMRVEQSWECAP